jgi:signal transduction histidine kinase
MQLLHSARLVSLGQMAAGVAHELNQPLTVISGAAEDVYLRLVEGLDISQEQLKEKMKDVLNLAERMTGTVEHLRIFSRDTSKQPGVEFSMNEVIHSSLRLIEAQLKSHGISLHLDLADGLPPVSGHPHQMEQVFLNLLGNARDALDEKTSPSPSHEKDDRRPSLSHWEREGMGVGEVARTTNHESRGWEKGVWVRTRREGDEVVAEVEDNGVGMDEGVRARLFEPFFTTKPAERGTGIGLSICYAIVQNHGGRIEVESEAGKGTTFRVRLPVKET